MAVYLSHTDVCNWTDRKTWQEAQILCCHGGVRQLQVEGSRVHAEIGPVESPVFTRFIIQHDGTVFSDCPCFQNQKYNTVCVHVVAAGIAIADQTEDPQRERRKRINERIQNDRKQGESPHPMRFPEGTPGTVPALLRVRVPETWLSDLERDTVRVDIHIIVDDWKHSPERIGNSRRLAFSPRHIDLLYVLEDLAPSPVCPASLTLTADTFAQLLMEMTDSGLHVTGCSEPIRISGEQAICALHVSMDDRSGELCIGLRTEPDGQVVLQTSRSGWLLSDNMLYRMDAQLPHGMHKAALKTLRIPRSQVFRFLKETLPGFQSSLIVENDVDEERFAIQTGVPAFEVQIQGTAEQADLSLWAIYEGTRFDTHAPPHPGDLVPIHGAPFSYLARNTTDETDAGLQFMSYFSDPANANGHITVQGDANVIHVMADIIPAFERLGWNVRFGDDVASLADHALWIKPCIKIAAGDNQHTYRMDMGYTDEVGSPVSTDTVDSALRNGQAVIKQDGRTLLLNVPGVKALASALAECIEYHDGLAYVSLIHAGFIQALATAFGSLRLDAPEEWRAHATEQQEKANLTPAPLQAPLIQQLRPYQREGVNWLCFLDRCSYCGILADEMGLGKTVQALAWLQIRRDEARQAGHALPSIVICPTSLIHNWAREVQRFTPSLSFRVVSGTSRQRLWEHLRDCDLVITSYALLRRDISHYDGIMFSSVILDEAQHIKNRSTQNATAAKRLKGLRRLVLTGTPIENSVNDLWSIMDFLMPGYLGTHTSFKIRFEQPISAGSLNAQRALTRLHMKLEPFMLRRLKVNVAADLPDKVTRIADCPMLPAQRRIYRRLLAEYHDNLSSLVTEQGFERARFSVFTALLRLRQCCCHPALLRHISGAAEAESGKMDLFLELLDEAMDGGHRVLVFSQFVQMLHILRDALRKRSIPFAYLDGATRDRMAQVDAFNNNPSIPVFLVSLKAGGSGLNLTGANVVIHYDPWWNPAVEDQATDRTHRIGQTQTVYSIKLVTENSIEQKVIELQQRKRVMINATIGMADSFEGSLTWTDVQELLNSADKDGG